MEISIFAAQVYPTVEKDGTGIAPENADRKQTDR